MTYNKNQNYIDYYMGYYNHQYKGNELIKYSIYFFYDKSWLIEKIDKKKVYFNNSSVSKSFSNNLDKIKVNRVIPVSYTHLRAHETRFWLNGHTTSNVAYAKLLELMDVLYSFETHSALVAISTIYFEDEQFDLAEHGLADFLEDNFDSLYPKIKKVAVVV